METILDLANSQREPAMAARSDTLVGRWPFREQIFQEIDTVAEPIVVIGSGPAGMRAVHELSRRAPERHIIWYGAERGKPYDRSQLTTLMAGEADLDGVIDGYHSSAYAKVERRFGCEVTQIDRNARLVIDKRHRFQPYSTLILATGSTARVPEGIDVRLPGVFTLRRLKDAQALIAQRRQSCCTVILGGGMLGLEAARAMQSAQTKVIVIERNQQLLPRHLDASAAQLLREYLEARGLGILLNAQVQEVYGDGQLQGLMLADRVLPCDTLIIATGGDPNVQLARMAGLRVNRGIEIDDRTVTSDPHIHAIGECAEHRGVSYGAVEPGLEQARVAAAITTGAMARYTGSTPVTRLKVIDIPVFSMGSELAAARDAGVRVWTHRSSDRNSRVRLVTRNGQVVGASAIGHATDMNHLQQAVAMQLRVRPWHLLRFLLTGRTLAKPLAAANSQDSSAELPSRAATVNDAIAAEVGSAEPMLPAPVAWPLITTAQAADAGEESLPAAEVTAPPTRTNKPTAWSRLAATKLLDLTSVQAPCGIASCHCAQPA